MISSYISQGNNVVFTKVAHFHAKLIIAKVYYQYIFINYLINNSNNLMKY